MSYSLVEIIKDTINTAGILISCKGEYMLCQRRSGKYSIPKEICKIHLHIYLFLISLFSICVLLIKSSWLEKLSKTFSKSFISETNEERLRIIFQAYAFLMQK